MPPESSLTIETYYPLPKQSLFQQSKVRNKLFGGA